MDYGIRFQDLDPSLQSLISSKANNVLLTTLISQLSIKTVTAVNNVISVSPSVTGLLTIKTDNVISHGTEILISTTDAISITNKSLRIIGASDSEYVKYIPPGIHTLILDFNTNTAVMLSTNGTGANRLGPAYRVLKTGTATFNSIAGRVITHSLNIPADTYYVSITPSEDANGYIGEISVVKDINSFTVSCTGETNNKKFDYIMVGL